MPFNKIFLFKNASGKEDTCDIGCTENTILHSIETHMGCQPATVLGDSKFINPSTKNVRMTDWKAGGSTSLSVASHSSI